jgi:beta-lactamase superfamily II metal-dependent hydrolase
VPATIPEVFLALGFSASSHPCPCEATEEESMEIPIKDGLLQIFNVDHGACALLTMPSGQRVLIDCGHSTDYKGAPWTPGAHLQQGGIKHIDLLICTNYDEDHASGVPSLLQKNVSVGCILGNPTVPAEVIAHLKTEDGMGRGIELIASSLAGRKARGEPQHPPAIPGLELSWFWNPWPYWDTENNLSLVAHLSIHGFNFLFPGDMEHDGFDNMLRYQPFAAQMRNVHVLMASHHGRENGKCEAMFDQHGCNPYAVVISDCAKRHQTQETTPYYHSKAKGVANFRQLGNVRRVLTTRSDDAITFQFDAGNCLVF